MVWVEVAEKKNLRQSPSHSCALQRKFFWFVTERKERRKINQGETRERRQRDCNEASICRGETYDHKINENLLSGVTEEGAFPQRSIITFL